MKSKIVKLLFTFFISFYSLNSWSGTLFGEGSGPVVNLGVGYEPTANFLFGWGNWDQGTLSYIYLSYFLSYAPTKIDKNGKLPSGITKTQWDKNFRNLNSVYYDSIRLGYYGDSFDPSSPLTGNVFIYHNSFRNFSKNPNAMGNASLTGLGIGVDLGYTFIDVIKIYLGGDWLPGFLSFGGKLSNSSVLNMKGQYEVRAGIKYLFSSMFTFSFEWKWGRVQAVDYVYPVTKNSTIGRMDSIEATIYNTGMLGVTMKF